jgi:hypothetical protein
MSNLIIRDLSILQRKEKYDVLLGTALSKSLYPIILSDASVTDYNGQITFNGIVKYVSGSPAISDFAGLFYLRKITDLYLFMVGSANVYDIVPDITIFTSLNKLTITATSATSYVVRGDIGAVLSLQEIDINTHVTANLATRTNLKKIALGTTGGSQILPNLGNNTLLNYFSIAGSATKYTTTGAIGTLRNCILLTTFNYFGSQIAAVTTTITDYMLSELLIAKQNGGALTSVNIGGQPTGGSTGNASAIALRALGVTVTVNA